MGNKYNIHKHVLQNTYWEYNIQKHIQRVQYSQTCTTEYRPIEHNIHKHVLQNSYRGWEFKSTILVYIGNKKDYFLFKVGKILKKMLNVTSNIKENVECYI